MKQNKRIVIKVGSHVLTEKGTIAKRRMLALVELISDLKIKGYEVILVSSGAVSAGYTQLPLERSIVANKQALASIGQAYLMKMYQEKFYIFDLLCSQVLLSADVFESQKQSQHAKNAIDTLLANGVIPIINENDTVSIEELVFGDNDRLSAHVAHYFDASLLVILSDIDAFYDKDPHQYPDAKRRAIVTFLSKEELEAEQTPNNEFATGGIVTKLQSAHFLMQHNKEMFLASGFNLSDVRAYLVDENHQGGTLFRNEAVEKAISKKPKKVAIYCDGACQGNPGEAGSGIAVYEDDVPAILFYGAYTVYGTNNTAELDALRQAMLLASQYDKDTEIMLYSDSKYSIDCVSVWAYGWKKNSWTKKGGEIKNLEIIKEIHTLYERLKERISLKHVKGHSGVEGNELADRMAIYAIRAKSKNYQRYSYSDTKSVLAL